MDVEIRNTIWLIYDSELVREDCVRRFDKVGVEIRTVRWDEGMADLIHKVHRDDWVIFDYEELLRLGPDFADPFKVVVSRAHVIVMAADAVDPRELGLGWVQLSKSVNCATVCAVVESLTGTRGCLEPGCCGHLG